MIHLMKNMCRLMLTFWMGWVLMKPYDEMGDIT
jgi:hypothetical protein